MKKPVINQKIYLPTSLYISHGRDDIQGGLATIDKIDYNTHLPDNHCNFILWWD